MGSVTAIFDTLQWVKGEWHAHSWHDDLRPILTADSYETDVDPSEGLSCNGVCTMGAIHVALGRINRYNNYYNQVPVDNSWLADKSESVRLTWFREMLWDVGDLVAAKMFGTWALEQDKPHTRQYGKYASDDLEGSGDIIAWNDHDDTTEEEVMAFLDVLDGYPPFRGVSALLDLGDELLKEEFEAYRQANPFLVDYRVDEHLDALVAISAI